MHKRQVAVGLIMMVIVTIVCTVIANFDPLGNNNPWITWLPLVICGLLGCFAAIFVCVLTMDDTSDNEDFFHALLAIGVIGTLFGAVAAGATTSSVADEYFGLIWASYGMTLAAYMVTGLVGFLATPNPPTLDQKIREISRQAA